MKNIKKRFAKSISLFTTLIALLISRNVAAQNIALQQSSKSIPADIVKPCGTYTKSGILVQALSSISNDDGCITTIAKSSDVHFTARNKIVLLPGFKAYEGSKFLADIKPFTPADKEIQLAFVNELSKNVTVSPNPFKNSFTVFINAAKDCKAQVILHNSVGVKAKEQININLSKGTNKLVVNASDLASGLYILEVSFGDSRVVNKIMKSE